MRARDVVGRKITRVRQQRRTDTNGGGVAVEVLGIDLEGNRHLYFSVAEQEEAADYIVCAHVASGADMDPSENEVTELSAATVVKLVELLAAINKDPPAWSTCAHPGSVSAAFDAALEAVNREAP